MYIITLDGIDKMLISLFKNLTLVVRNNETDQGHCFTAFGYLKEMNNFCYIWIASGWLLWTVNFLSLITDFEMSETCELLSWYLRGCICFNAYPLLSSMVSDFMVSGNDHK